MQNLFTQNLGIQDAGISQYEMELLLSLHQYFYWKNMVTTYCQNTILHRPQSPWSATTIFRSRVHQYTKIWSLWSQIVIRKYLKIRMDMFFLNIFSINDIIYKSSRVTSCSQTGQSTNDMNRIIKPDLKTAEAGLEMAEPPASLATATPTTTAASISCCPKNRGKAFNADIFITEDMSYIAAAPSTMAVGGCPANNVAASLASKAEKSPQVLQPYTSINLTLVHASNIKLNYRVLTDNKNQALHGMYCQKLALRMDKMSQDSNTSIATKVMEPVSHFKNEMALFFIEIVTRSRLKKIIALPFLNIFSANDMNRTIKPDLETAEAGLETANPPASLATATPTTTAASISCCPKNRGKAFNADIFIKEDITYIAAAPSTVVVGGCRANNFAYSVDSKAEKSQQVLELYTRINLTLVHASNSKLNYKVRTDNKNQLLHGMYCQNLALKIDKIIQDSKTSIAKQVMEPVSHNEMAQFLLLEATS